MKVVLEKLADKNTVQKTLLALNPGDDSGKLYIRHKDEFDSKMKDALEAKRKEDERLEYIRQEEER